jgi:hypothetical protein
VRDHLGDAQYQTTVRVPAGRAERRQENIPGGKPDGGPEVRQKVMKAVRFATVEWPKARVRARAERIDFVRSYRLCPDRQDEITMLLAQGYSLRRALRRCQASAEPRQRARMPVTPDTAA